LSGNVLGLPRQLAGRAVRSSLLARPCRLFRFASKAFGLPPAAALIPSLSRVATLLCGGFAAC